MSDQQQESDEERARWLSQRRKRQEQFEEALAPLADLVNGLRWERQQRAEQLIRALDEAVLGEPDAIGERLYKLAFLVFFGGVLVVVPIGITASVFAYSIGLSSEVGKWMFFSGVAFGALAGAMGFLIGQSSPERHLRL